MINNNIFNESNNEIFVIDQTICIKCGVCYYDCPSKAISVDKDEVYFINTDGCTKCENCKRLCPAYAIVIKKI